MGYRAPELLANGNATFNNKADIWSLGCILFELSVGRRPFFHDYATAAYGTANDDMIVELDDSFSYECKRTLASTIISMLKSRPKSRPSATQLLKDFNRYFMDTVPLKNGLKQSPAIDNVEHTGPMRLNSSLVASGTFLFSTTDRDSR
jgi:serine/threonine protein kinase